MPSDCIDIDASLIGTPNCCKTSAVYSKCYVAWYIENFSYCRQGNGDYLQSCIFYNKDSPDELKYRLYLFPNGTKDSLDDVVVSLRLVTDKSDVRALLKYTCGVASDGKICSVKSGEKFIVPGSYTQDISLIRREDLLKRKDELLKGDVLCIACLVSSSYKETEQIVTPPSKL